MSTRLRWAFGALQRSLPVLRHGARGAIAVAGLAVWYALLLLDDDSSLPQHHRAHRDAETIGSVSRESPVYTLAASLEDAHWVLKRCEAVPDKMVGDVAGYHVILEHDWWDVDTELAVSMPDIRQTFVQLYFVSDDQSATLPSPNTIAWRKLTDTPPGWVRVDGPPESVSMGTVDGFHVFGYMTIPLQEGFRDRLGTSGGDNRLELLERQIERNISVPAYLKTIRVLVRHGDPALPVLRREIDRLAGPQRQGVIISLIRIPGPESAKMIRALYQQDDMRDEIAHLMRIGPRRSDLEDIYAGIWATAEDEL